VPVFGTLRDARFVGNAVCKFIVADDANQRGRRPDEE
jgi:hypothetical protein